jgi:hypothetical protein
MQPPDFYSNLGANGPWAAMAGFLLWQVIKAWNGDRETLVKVLGGVNETLHKLGDAVEDLAMEQRRMSAVLEKITNEIPE